MAHTPDHITIEVKTADKKHAVNIDPLFPRIVRGAEFEVTVTLGSAKKLTLGPFFRLEDRDPPDSKGKGKGKRKKEQLLANGYETISFDKSESKKIKLVPKKTIPEDDNYRYVEYTLTLDCSHGEVFAIDPMWDEMP